MHSWPMMNAALNATSGILILSGFWAIRARRAKLHAGLLIAACGVSILFLVSYVLYHFQVGSVRFPGTGWIRPVYFSFLISHTLLALIILPLVYRTLSLAVRKRWPEHVRLARWTFPLWLYVSASGIVVYGMLYHGPWQ